MAEAPVVVASTLGSLESAMEEIDFWGKWWKYNVFH
jgi:hypothetical protein